MNKCGHLFHFQIASNFGFANASTNRAKSYEFAWGCTVYNIIMFIYFFRALAIVLGCTDFKFFFEGSRYKN